MIGGTQPARISQYLAQVVRGGRGNDGLIQRFGMMVWPDISATWRNVDRKPKPEASEAAFKVFQALDALEWGAIGGMRDRMRGDEHGLPYLRLSRGAHELFLDCRAKLEHRLRQGELEPMLEGHLAKYRKLIPGLALIIHLSDGGKGEVGVPAVEKALKWAAYLETHAARVYASTSIAATDAARAIMAKIKSGHLKQEFGSREIIRAQWSMLRHRERVHAGLQLLVDHDWLTRDIVETGGRKATVYRANPKALSQENVHPGDN
jgi:putative DNA primase/helicase